MITEAQPLLESDPFDCYVWGNNDWLKNSCDLTTTGWGTVQIPFDYYANRPIKNAAQYPAAVTYLYHKHTASLLGGPYDFGGGERPYKLKWEDPAQKVTYGKLGSQSLKWLILYGCKAVINSDENGDYLPLANKALTAVHGGYHMILGHRYSYFTSDLMPTETFARALLFGRPVQEAYFEIDPIQNSSALAAEDYPFNWETSTMERDTWVYPIAVPNPAFAFSERWIRTLSPLIGENPKP